ncbi:hypothetical protein ABEB36_000601 [Hypothenemus hampei]|uniref:Uncharacterized protein n=1 Tax=Hypothenemus hampei TaxID=57062 RepID=A0ABD1FBU0_HYPHA
MSDQNLWQYHSIIFRIIEESLEVSLVICKSDLQEFTIAKIFDIFNQILPSAFVLNTGYWPFFNTIKKQSICICGRYGMECRHFKHDYHWIDISSLRNDNSAIFRNKWGNLTLLDFHMDLIPMTSGAAGYYCHMKLTFQYKRIEKGRPKRKKLENINITPDQPFSIMISCRYILQREYYPALQTIMFQPSPFFYQTYGSIFPKLLKTRANLARLPAESIQSFYAVAAEEMPHFTLILQHVNLPTYQYSRSMIPAPLTYLDHMKQRKMTMSKETQTELVGSNEVWKYKELFNNLGPSWNDSYEPSCNSKPYEELDTNLEVNDVMEALKRQPGTSDNQNWNLVKRRPRKKYQNIQLFGNNVNESRRQTLRERCKMINGPMTQLSTYAEILKCPKGPAVQTKKFPQLDMYKKDAEFQWFETQFPDLPRCSETAKVILDENFDLAEELVKQEKQREMK